MGHFQIGGVYFNSQEEADAFYARSVVEEAFHQKAVVVRAAADSSLRASLESLLPGAGARPGQIEFFAIDEDGEHVFLQSLTAAKEWGRARNKMFVVGHVRLVETYDLPDAEVAARVEAMEA
jgi:hypothetical protein